MKKTLYIFLIFTIISTKAIAATPKDTIKIDANLQVISLTEKIYLYTAWDEIEGWGRVGSNGLIIKDNNQAFIIDTPTTESQTEKLHQWITHTLKARPVGFAPGHWHADCVGGMAYLSQRGVATYANEMTNEILKKLERPTAKHSFTDSLNLSVGKTRIELKYIGGGHSTDNIVVWIPTEKVLFAGCMLKDILTNSMGNTADAAPVDEWLKTVEKVEQQFKNAAIIVPGHGQSGGTEIIKHTKRILESNL